MIHAHGRLSIAVPTRDRPECLTHFISSLKGSTPAGRIPFVTFIHDAPYDAVCDEALQMSQDAPFAKTRLVLRKKSSLTRLWNQCIINSPTDWVLICGDDILFLPGWLDHLEQRIATGKYDQIHLSHYSGFCIHKSFILKLGWFDERFQGGYYEDNDWQLRISEAGLKDRVDWFDNEVWLQHPSSREKKWICKNNPEWIVTKWTRNYDWLAPSFRRQGEVDHYPETTKQYEQKFQTTSRIDYINNTLVNNGKPVFH